MAKRYKVTKHNGETEALDILKIRQVIKIAGKGLNINEAELESNLDFSFVDRMKTSDIHNALIQTANSLTSIDAPDWRILSARLRFMSYYKQVAYSRGFEHTYGYPDFFLVVDKLVDMGLYSDALVTKYSKKDRQKISRFLNHSLDNDFDYAGANLMISRYCLKNYGKPMELPQEAFLAIAMLIEQNQPKSERLLFVRDTYEKLAKRKISLATPILMNLRKPGGNLSSCFTVPFDDDTNNIFHTIEQIGKISASGGGVGTNLSKIRAKGASIGNRVNASSGIVPNIKVVNDLMVYWNQGGSRAGACTVAIPAWHYDLEEFLELQTENGDVRTKAYDIFPQVIINDLFMKRQEEKGDWYLFDPHEVRNYLGFDLDDVFGEEFEAAYARLEQAYKDGELKIVKKIDPKAAYKQILRTQIETGMPYEYFIDTANRVNPTPNVGPIRNVNLCTESFSSTQPSKVGDRVYKNGKQTQEIETGLTHTCNLVSINLANIDSMEELHDVCDTAVRILDNTIDITDVPIPEGQRHNELLRTIGVGTMGLADYMAKNDESYVTQAQKGYALVKELYENFAYGCTKASIKLAEERGSFEAFEGSQYDKGIILGKTVEEMNASSSLDWTGIYEDLKKYGIRNSIITAIAPNTSSSIIQGCTASILPPYSKFFIDSAESGNVPIMPPFVSEKMWFYNEAKNVDQEIIVDLTGVIQEWIDTGISMEVLWNLNDDSVTAKKIYDVHFKAWKNGCKAIYYTRSTQRQEKEECVSCAG